MPISNGSRTSKKLSINTNQSAPQGIGIDVSPDSSFVINYASSRKFDSLSPLLKQSIMDAIGESNSEKFNGTIYDIVQQSDGKILVGGSFSGYAGYFNRNRLIRLNNDGTVDETFCQNASDNSKFNDTILCLGVQSDGKILVGGDFINYGGITNRNRLIRLNSDGTVDETFCQNASDGAKFNNSIYTICVQSSGKILVGGAFSDYGGTIKRNLVIRLDNTGSVDNLFCNYATDPSVALPLYAKFRGSSTGTTIGSVRSIIQFFDGINNLIYIGGVFVNYINSAETAYVTGRNRFIRLIDTGTSISVDDSFCINASDSSKFSAQVSSIAIYPPNGDIFVGGNFTNYGGTTGRNRFIRLNSSGIVNGSFCSVASDGNKFSSDVNTVCIINDLILVGGTFDNYSSILGLNSFVSIGISNGELFSMTGYLTTTNTVRKISTIFKNNGQLRAFVGGTFEFYGTQPIKNLVVLDDLMDVDILLTTNTSGIFSVFSDDVYSIVIQPDNKILVGGNFIDYDGTTNRNRLVRLNSDGTVDETFCQNASDAGKFNNTIFTIVIQSDGKILVGGNFTSYPGIGADSNPAIGRNNFIRLNADGTVDDQFCQNSSDNGKFNGSVYAIDLYGNSNQQIIVGGEFTNYAGTVGANSLIKFIFDGTPDNLFISSINNKFNTNVRCLLVESNYILVGGNFTNYDGFTNRSRLIKLDYNGGIPTLDELFCTSIVDNNFSNDVYSLAKEANNVYIGGSFTNYAGIIDRNRFIRITDNSGNWSVDNPFCINASDGNKIQNAVVWAIEIQPDNKIIIGGSFSNYAGITGRSRLVRLNNDGTTNEIFCNSVSDNIKINSTVRAVVIDSSYNLYVGGLFTLYSSQNKFYSKFLVFNPQLYGGIVQQQIGTGEIVGNISNGTVIKSNSYAELGNSGISIEIDNITGEIQYTSDNEYPYPDYQFNSGYLNISSQNT